MNFEPLYDLQKMVLALGLPMLALTLLFSVESKSQHLSRWEEVNKLRGFFYLQLNEWKYQIENEPDVPHGGSDLDDSEWQRVSLPFRWEKQTYWFRTTMTIPEHIAGRSIGNSP
ncbi:MAG: hypothetical protein AAB737_03400, partial [Patescibacteria group bacterium]